MSDATLFDYSTPRGPFSDPSPPEIVGQNPFCVWTIYGHGELLWSTQQTDTRSTYAKINEGWGYDMPNLGLFNRINYTVSKVVGPGSHAPGLAISSDDAPTTTNFALHIPKMTEVVINESIKVNSGALNSTTLDSLGAAVMQGIKDVDIAFDIDYAKEKTSEPQTASDADFYQTFKIDKNNFWRAAIRKIYMKPNFGEWLRPSGRLTRTVADGPHPFPIYGFFIIYAQGGSLPQSCTLFGAQALLNKTPVEVKGRKFPTFDEEEVKKYNLISVENRVAVEQKMGYRLGFLDINGILNTGMDPARWDDYRHNTNGVIQLLRRVIRTQEITHVEAARIIQSLGYNYMLGMDSACNCPGDRVVTQPPAVILDSLDNTVLPPIDHPILATLTVDELIELEKLRETQEKVLKIVRTVLIAADDAKAEAARAAEAAENNETEEVTEACLRATIKAGDAEKRLSVAFKLIKGTAFGNDPLLVRTIDAAKAAVEKAKEARKQAKEAAREATRKATDAAKKAKEAQLNPSYGERSRSNSPLPPPGGGSAKKYSRKRARSRTQKQKRYISRKNKQIKKYAKRHTMRNRRQNTSNKYSSL
jgi:hypothetical protein